MRSVKALLTAGLMVAGLPAVAHAQWYVGADVGGNYTQDSSVSAGANHDTTYNWGPVGLIEGGYQFGAVKLEGEVGYRSNSVDKVGSLSGGGNADSLSLMVNGLYDFGGYFNSRWHPFLGVGVGGAKVSSNDISRAGGYAYSGDQWQFAYQGIAGVGYDLTPNLMAKLQYRYFSTLDYDVVGAGNSTGNAEYHNHAVLVGLTYSFGAPPAPAPVPVAAVAPAPPPPPPALPPRPHNFMVFFDFDKATLTPEAARIISDAATAAKSGGVAHVSVTGHTDLSGSVPYNQKLSEKRADAVRDALVRQGVPASEIGVAAKGKSDPLVPTKDGVREPQNRRVVIVLE